jgi:hypothetical protein
MHLLLMSNNLHYGVATGDAAHNMLTRRPVHSPFDYSRLLSCSMAPPVLASLSHAMLCSLSAVIMCVVTCCIAGARRSL